MTIREHFDQLIREGHDAGWIAATAEKKVAGDNLGPFTRNHWLNLASFARYVEADIGRHVPTTCIEHAYGTAERLSFQIKVF